MMISPYSYIEEKIQELQHYETYNRWLLFGLDILNFDWEELE